MVSLMWHVECLMRACMPSYSDRKSRFRLTTLETAFPVEVGEGHAQQALHMRLIIGSLSLS